MADGISISLTNLEVIASLSKVLDPDAWAAQIRIGLEEAVEYIRQEIVRGMPEDTGRSKGMIFGEVHETGLSVEGSVYSDYIPVAIVEEGRTAGASYPPMEPIADWVERHGLDTRLTYVIVRKIGERGLPAHHIFLAAAERALPVATGIVADVLYKGVGAL